MTPPTVPPRKTGLAHLLAAARYSVGGLRRLARESAFRQEVALGGLVLVLLAIFGPGWGHVAGFAVLLCLLVAVEALNTAIEVLVDHLSPQWAEFARDAKDLGSLAVAAVLAGMGCYLAWMLLS